MLDISALPHETRFVVERELASGERILWLAQPNPRRLMLLALPIILFAIPWTAFSIFWMWGASGFGKPGGGAGIAFTFFGVPFVLVGLGMFSIPYWLARRARRTAYVITDHRAILFEGGWSMRIQSFPHGTTTNLYRRERRDGSGDIIFRNDTWRDSDGYRRPNEIGFFAIPNVRDVELLLQKLSQAAKH
jgi:hypothetical protein